MQAVVDNLLTNYQLQGKGKLVLFLHGWGDASTGSAVLQAELAKSFSVLAPDLPGFGNTQAPPHAWSLDDYVSFVTALLKKLDLSQPFAVIGHSNGGSIAIRGMAMGELQPEKLVLMGSAGIRSGRSLRRGMLQILAKVGNVATIGMPERYRKTLRRQLYKSAGSDLLAVEHMQETFKITVRQDVQSEASELTQPTLLIYGADDTATPPAMGKRYNDLINNSQLQIVDGAGHFVHLDKPGETTKLITDFLK